MTCEYGKIIKTKFFDQKFWMVQRGDPWNILKKWQKIFSVFFPKMVSYQLFTVTICI